MRRILIAVLALACFAATKTFAQSSATANVTLAVSSAIGITATQSTLNMGTAAAGTTDSVAYSSANAAFFTVSGTATTSFHLSWTGTQLTNGSWHLTPTYYLAARDTNAVAGASSITSGVGLTSNATGYYYIWAGASVAIPSNAAGGTYAGTLTLTVSTP